MASSAGKSKFIDSMIQLPPSNEPRGPPRAIHELNEPAGTSRAYVLETKSHPPIKLHFISAQDAVAGSFEPSPGLRFAGPEVNKYLKGDYPKGDAKHWAHFYVLIPEQPPHVAPGDSKVMVTVGPGGIPSQYEPDGPYVWVRSQDDAAVMEFEPPRQGTLCIRLDTQTFLRYFSPDLLPPVVPSLILGLEPPPHKVLDTLRIEISQQGYSDYLSLHVRIVDSHPSHKPPHGVQPYLYNVLPVKKLDSTIQDAPNDGFEECHHYLVKLTCLRAIGYPTVLKGGARKRGWASPPDSKARGGKPSGEDLA